MLHYNAKGELRAAATGAVIRAVLPDDETLEEMFLRTAQAT